MAMEDMLRPCLLEQLSCSDLHDYFVSVEYFLMRHLIVQNWIKS